MLFTRATKFFFYKRAQIFVGDVWGAFQGTGLGAFVDLDQLTCFADYRLPQLLRSLGIIKYSSALSNWVDEKKEIESGSGWEHQIRAATVQAVHRMCLALNNTNTNEKMAETTKPILPLQLDWILWERGEAQLAHLGPHHRVRTIYY